MNPNQESNFAQDTYQTGSTRPPKSHGGIIAFLMVLVIFLCGVSTALGLMNIRLFRALTQAAQPETSPVAFSPEEATSHEDEICFSLGFYGQEVPEIWSLYQDLPQGIYVTDVLPGSDAEKKGVQPGDILVQVDGQSITAASQLHSLLENRKTRSPVQVILYRNGQQMEMTLEMLNH